MRYTQGLIVDGIEFDIPFVSLKRNADFLDKTAERVESGGLYRELIGVFFNFTLTVGTSDNFGDGTSYEKFWDKMTEPVEFHAFVLPWGKGKKFSFRGYVSSVSDEYSKILEDDAQFKSFTCKMIAEVPARTPG